MNSVFSAFKSSKSDGSIQSNKVKKIGGPVNSSSYANLRHIREIGSSAKMSSFVGNNDDDDITPNLRLTKCTTTTTLHSSAVVTTSTPSSPSTSSMEQIIPQSTKTNTHQNDCDSNSSNSNISINSSSNNNGNTWSIHSELSHVNIDKGIVSTANDTTVNAYEQHVSPSAIPINSQSIASYINNIPSNGTHVTDGVADHSMKDSENKENTDTTNPSTNTSDLVCLNDSSIVSNGTDNISGKHHVHITNDTVQMMNGGDGGGGGCGTGNNSINSAGTNEKHTPILSAASNKKLNRHSESTAPIITSNKSTSSNRFYKRLSLSGISNNPLPSVHGRSTSNSQNGNNGNGGSGETKRTRISTHQRNLSLDFR